MKEPFASIFRTVHGEGFSGNYSKQYEHKYQVSVMCPLYKGVVGTMVLTSISEGFTDDDFEIIWKKTVVF